MMKKRTVLLIEDDPRMVELVSMHLEDAGFSVDSEATGPAGLSRALEHEYELIVLDVMLPEMDGLEICKKIRAHDPRIPILILTARSEELDKVLGLELGADDYITKPFSVREFIARVKSVLRRTSVVQENARTESDSCIRRGGLVIDQENAR